MGYPKKHRVDAKWDQKKEELEKGIKKNNIKFSEKYK